MGKFAEKARIAKVKKCAVGRAIEDFDDEDIEELERLVVKRSWAAITSVDGRLHSRTMRLHALGLCCCTDGAPVQGVITDG